MDNLLRFKFDQRFVIFDAETEGLNLCFSRPWQLSWIETKGKKIVSRHNFLLRWEDLNVSEGAAKVAGFDKAKYLKSAVDPYFVFQNFWGVINDDDVILVGHNILNFDVYMINVIRRNLGLPPDYNFINRCLDTRALLLSVTKDIKKPDDTPLIDWQYKLINMEQKGVRSTLSAGLKMFNIEFDEEKLHDAMYDIEKNAELFFALLNRVDI